MIEFAEFLIKSSLLLVCALLFCRFASVPSAMKHIVLLTALLAVPVLPLLGAFGPNAIEIETPRFVIDLFEAPDIDAAVAVPAERVGSGATSLATSKLLLWIYLIGFACCLATLVARFVRLERWVRRCSVLDHRILQSEWLGSPFTWRIFRPVIVVPRDWQSWSDAQRRAAVDHEAAHIARRDALTSMSSAIVRALCWFHPLVWLAHRRLLAEAEHACDDSVINAGVAPLNYAHQLLQIGRSRAGIAPAMAASSHLAQRIRALLDPSTRRIKVTKLHIVATVVACLFSIAVVGTTGTAVAASAENGEGGPISPSVYDALSSVQGRIDEKAYGDASKEVNALLDAGGLTSAELGQVYNMRAYLHFLREDYARAIDDYTNVIAQDDIPRGLRVTTLYTLAQLEFVTERYPQALARIESWLEEAEDPGPQPYIFMGQVRYQMKDYENALLHIDKGIAIAQDRGDEIKPNWHQLREFLVKTLEDPSAAAVPPSRVESADGDLLPIVRVKPIYPYAARQNGIEGYVVLEFTVSETGSTAAIEVVDASPPETFDIAAVEAVEKYKYKPRVVDGTAVATPGVRATVNFEIKP